MRDGAGLLRGVRGLVELADAYQRDLGLDMISFHDRPEAVEQLAPELPRAPGFPDDAFDKWPTRGVTLGLPRRPRAR